MNQVKRSQLLNILLGRNAQQQEAFIKMCLTRADTEHAVLAAMLRDGRANLWELTRQVACILQVVIIEDLPHVKPMRQSIEYHVNQWTCDLYDIIESVRDNGYRHGFDGMSSNKRHA